MYVKFGAVSRENDILSITAQLKFDSKTPFETYVTSINAINHHTPHFVSSELIFS